jgi:hypothetical protein
MAFEVKNPFKGLSRTQVYAVIAGSALLLGIIEWRHHKSAGTWNPFSKGNPAGTGTTIDPVTGMAYSQDNVTDPVTGLTYLAEAQQYGSVQAAESSVSQFGQTSDTGTGTGVQPAGGGAGSSNASTGSVSSSTYTSNAAWAQAATAGLADIGYPETDVATALGDYLTGTPLTPDQVNYVQAALAEFGNPPIGSFQIIRQPIHTPGPDMKSVPYVVGLDVVEAQRDITDAGLKSSVSGPAWKVGHDTRIVTASAPVAGTKLTPGSNVKLTYKINKTVRHPAGQ